MKLQKAYRPADPDENVEMSVGDLLRSVATRHPTRTALIDGTAGDSASRRRISYAELLSLAEGGARDLLSRFSRDSNIAIWAPNSLDWVILEFSAAIAGLPLVMINPSFTGHEASYILQQSRSSGIFVAERYRKNPLAQRIAEIKADLPALRDVVSLQSWAASLSESKQSDIELPRMTAADTAAIQYTSGTTGKPKGAVQSHRAATNIARALTQRLGTAKGSVWLLPLPLYSVGGSMFKVIGSLWNEGSLVILPDFDEALILRMIEEEHVAFFSAVPTMYLRLLEHPDLTRRDLTSLDILVCGGSTVPEDLVRRIERTFGAEYMMMFGLTEMCGTVCQTVRGDSTTHKARTVGKPLPGIEVQIISTEGGQIVGIDEPGEICVRGAGRMKEYFEMPEATAAAVDESGWLHTGDIGTMADDGYCTITGRLKDMIRRGGVNIYPREIEDVLVTHEAIAEAVAFGIDDAHWGEQVAVAIRLHAGKNPSIAVLETFLREKIAPHKIPKYWEFVESFPVNAMGKVQKNVLKERFDEKQSTASTR